ncbi:MAG: HisA/HisF-related TIM barrel protein [Thermoplasmata archaeon]|nr:HisA/HisF-related TIM barrel protein [Thermoplasmata archaeon]
MMDERVIPRLRIENYNVVDAARKVRVGTDTILDFFERISEENEVLYILDLNGIKEGTPHLDLLSEISDLVPVWVEANSKSVEDVSDLLMAGAEKAVLHTGMVGPSTLQKIADETANFALVLDESGIPNLDRLYDFLRRTGCEVILRAEGVGIPYSGLKDLPVVLDIPGAGANLVREKLNIVGRIVEMDLDDL